MSRFWKSRPARGSDGGGSQRVRSHAIAVRGIGVAVALIVAALLQARGAFADGVEGGAANLVVVALPVQTDPAIIEALSRLRGEATSVGFEVRLMNSTADSLSLAQLESLWADLRPAAVVAFTRPSGDPKEAHTLDVTFLDRTSGKATVAHLDAGEAADTLERADVVIAVRAVDFIRARMFDALVGRRPEPAPPPPPPVAPPTRFELGAGLVVLGAANGFSLSVAPQLSAGYRPLPWLRVGVLAFGFGGESLREAGEVRVGLEQWFVGGGVTLLGPYWHRLQPSLEVGGGEHWVVARGYSTTSSAGGLAPTLSSLALSTSAGLGVEILPFLALELRVACLWLQNQARINTTEDTYLASLGRPLWFASAGLGTRF